MDSIRQQVQLAQRYLNGAKLLRFVTLSTCGALSVAVLAIAIPKLFAIGFLQDAKATARWELGWLIVAVVAGLALGMLLAWITRASTLEAAIAVDTRFKLRERLSSALALSDDDQRSKAGQALLRDAQRSADRIDVRDHFSYGFHWRNLIPLLPLACILGLSFFFENALVEPVQARETLTAEDRLRIENAQEQLRKKLDEEVKRAEELGLKEAEVALREVDRVLADRKPNDRPKEDSLVRLNDARQKLEERMKKLGDAKSMKNRLSRLEPQKSGPADKVSQALSEGKIDEAVEELEQLADRARKGELTPEERQSLADQLADLKKQLQDQADRQREQEQSLEQQLQQAKNEGDQQRVESLEQQLAEQQQQNPQTQQLESLADSMGQASQSMSNSDSSQGADAQSSQALSDAAEQLQEVNANLTEAQLLEGMLDQISQCKRMVQDPNAQPSQQGSPQMAQGGQPGPGQSADAGAGNQPGASGQGNQGGQGNGDQVAAGNSNGSGNGQGNGQGNGSGQGTGARAENENATDFENSQVAGNPRPGEAVVTGTSGGANVSGKSRSEVFQEVQASLSSNSDPLTDQTLPRRQRDQAREYFRQFSDAKNNTEDQKKSTQESGNNR